MGNLTINRSELRAHVQKLKDIAGKGGTTVKAADAAGIGNHGLYGVPGRLLVVPLLTGLLRQQQDTLHSFTQLLDDVAATTEGALKEYTIIEDVNTAASGQIKVP